MLMRRCRCYDVDNMIDDYRQILTVELKSKHHHKLEKLGITSRITLNSTNITIRNNHQSEKTSRNAIFNLSDYVLNQAESQLLSKGLKYGIYTKKVDTFEILSRFEQLAQSLDRLPLVGNQDERMADLDSKNGVFQQL